ncbi:hypothetical protein DM01DRAFT_1328036 [Hesseltinella vesiculosa]|uniref:Dihydrofolate reductase n=1 Tax=Hesseltinella vesiculosa TaxID=101127 RepID=A0A1X2G698_9FUNG|nr:hypothetical protein DM01DRAFT_1328036 [Hesseltinella vesiculosa]
MVFHDHPVIVMAAALDDTMGIGFQQDLPWKLPGDWAYFQQITTKSYDDPDSLLEQESDWHNIVIMGRLSWESVPMRGKPLHNRFNIVVSTSYESQNMPALEHVALAKTLPMALDHAKQLKKSQGRIFILGGAQIYQQAVDQRHCTHILLTHIKTSVAIPCDTFFPAIDPMHYRLATHTELEHFVQESVPRGWQQHDDFSYQFVLYIRSQ